MNPYEAPQSPKSRSPSVMREPSAMVYMSIAILASLTYSLMWVVIWKSKPVPPPYVSPVPLTTRPANSP